MHRHSRFSSPSLFIAHHDNMRHLDAQFMLDQGFAVYDL
jgi:hypothetical protein